MRDTPGRVIYKDFSENTLMEVVDHGTTRSLYFSETILQSRILLSDPQKLLLYYPRYMVSTLLIKPKPAKILIIGIGAGSLIHFFSHHFPDCHIDAVDSSAKIIEIAQTFFFLKQNSNTSLHCQDGFDFLSSNIRTKSYDTIFIDAFDETGMAKKIYSREFFGLCMQSLSNDGVLSLNLWSGNEKTLKKVKKSLHKQVEGHIYIPVRKRENIVALAFSTTVPWEKFNRPSHELRSLSKQVGIDFEEITSVARKKNMKIGHRIAAWIK